MDQVLLLVVVVVVTLVVSAYRRNKGNTKPKLGYTVHSEHDLHLPKGKGWRVDALEEMPMGDRRRAVVTLFCESDWGAQIERLTWFVADRIQRAGQMHAVLVEAHLKSVPPTKPLAEDELPPTPNEVSTELLNSAPIGLGTFALLYAPDGAGWNGEDRLIAATRKPKSTKALGLASVHQAILDADGVEAIDIP